MDTDIQLMNQLRNVGKFLHDSLGKKPIQRKALGYLHQKGKLTQKQFQEAMEIKPSSASEILGKLENEGYIRRYRCQDDQRNVFVELTELGKKQARIYRVEYLRILELLFEEFSEDEKETLYKELTRLLHTWNELTTNDEFIQLINRKGD